MPEKDISPVCMETLLRDHTTGRNIFWATHDYESLGSDYGYYSEILPHLITGGHGMVIRPRVMKSKDNQTDRSKDMAEVFTPSWLCDAQINLVDAQLKEEGWKEYVRTTCLEITCGEAPYLVSRYDATTGETIPIAKRIGMLDRKLRVISANARSSSEWLEWAKVALQNTYGYEWQGDSLLLARQNLLLSFMEHYCDKFGQQPPKDSIENMAEIISWNLWQMDGLRGVVPGSCRDGLIVTEDTLFGTEERTIQCPGCQQEDIRLHNGRYCIIRDWKNSKEIRFVDLIK